MTAGLLLSLLTSLSIRTPKLVPIRTAKRVVTKIDFNRLPFRFFEKVENVTGFLSLFLIMAAYNFVFLDVLFCRFRNNPIKAFSSIGSFAAAVSKIDILFIEILVNYNHFIKRILRRLFSFLMGSSEKV